MRRLLHLVLALLLFVLAGVLPGQVTGVVTVGTGAPNSVGDFNVGAAPYSGDASAAIQAALAMRGHVVILPGQYVCPTPIDVGADNVVIDARGAILMPTSNTTTKGQLWNVTGDRFRLDGGEIRLTNFTDNQFVVYLNGSDFSVVDGTSFTAAYTPVAFTAPMTAVRGAGSKNLRVKYVYIQPGRGLNAFSFRTCANVTIDEPQIGNSWSAQPYGLNQVFDFNDSTHATVNGGAYYGVGDTSNKLGFILRAYNSVNGDLHLNVNGGYYESIAVDRGFQAEGSRHATFNGVQVASFTNTATGIFCAVGSTGDTTGIPMNEFEVLGCVSHDNCKNGGQPSAAPLVYVRKAVGVTIMGNIHKVAYSPLVAIDTVFASNVVIANNVAKSTQAPSQFAGGVQSAITLFGAQPVTRWRVLNNTVFGQGANGFQNLWATPPAGVVETGTLVLQ